MSRLKDNLEIDLKADKENKKSSIVIQDGKLIILKKKSDKKIKLSTDFKELTEMEKELQAYFEKNTKKKPKIINRDCVKLALKKEKEAQRSYDNKFKKISDLYNNRNHNKKEAYKNQKNLMDSKEFKKLMKQRLKKNDLFIVDRIAVKEQLNSTKIQHGRVEIKSEKSEKFDRNNDIYEYCKFFVSEKIKHAKDKNKRESCENKDLEIHIKQIQENGQKLLDETDSFMSQFQKNSKDQLQIAISADKQIETLKKEIECLEKRNKELSDENCEFRDAMNAKVTELRKAVKEIPKDIFNLVDEDINNQSKEIETLKKQIIIADSKNTNFKKIQSRFKDAFIFSNITLTLLYFATFFIPTKNKITENKDKIFLALFLLTNTASFSYFYKKSLFQ